MTMITVTLRDEADAEARRLGCARRLMRDGDAQALGWLECDATWIALPRRGRLRRALRRRVCLVWRAAFEDAFGRSVESMLIPVLVDRGWEAFEPAVRARVEAECDAWAREVLRVEGAVTSVRLSRMRRIDLGAVSTVVAPQPGLFDRRAERSVRSLDAAAAESARDNRDRARSIVAGEAITRLPARLMLVLVP